MACQIVTNSGSRLNDENKALARQTLIKHLGEIVRRTEVRAGTILAEATGVTSNRDDAVAAPRSTVASRGVRLQFLDAARGSAMLFVLISHFAATYFDDPTRGAARVLIEIGHVATPTFILISGILVGFLYRTRPAGFDRFRIRLIDRGLFLLTINRILMTLFSWPTMHTARYVIITDVIGVSMIVGPWVIAHLSPARRLAVSAGLYAASWVAIESWHPQGPAGWFVQETFFGNVAPKFYLYTCPLIPWFSFELAASVVGDHLGRLYQRDDLAGMARLLRTIAVLALSLSAVAKGLYLAAVATHRFGPEHAQLQSVAHMLTSRFQFPPAPVYLLFYGGLGLGVLSLWLVAEHRARLPRLCRFAVILGQTRSSCSCVRRPSTTPSCTRFIRACRTPGRGRSISRCRWHWRSSVPWRGIGWVIERF
jgi:uncharacterized membrane protein